MSRRVDRPKLDEAALAAAVEGLRERGATCRARIPVEGTTVCVDAVNAGRSASTKYSEAASRRAAIGGRRMLPVVGAGKVDRRFWIAYDTGSMTPLSECRDRRLLSTATSVRVLSDVARALDEAAAAGVFAWELAPASVFLTGKGARLGDLGTAREGLAGARFEVQGDPAYVPPEVLAGRRAGERSGVYLFGALLHYVLTGAPRPRGGSASREGGRLDLPASIGAIVEAAMADEPDRRPETASQANEMARRALRGERPAPARKRRGGNAPSARTDAPARKRRGRKAGPARMDAPARKGRGRKAGPAKAGVAARKRLAATASLVRRAAAARSRLKPNIGLVRPPVVPAVAVGGALVFGGIAGLLLGASSHPDPARPETVTAGGLSVSLPAGRHRVETRGKGLAVRAPGSLLRARIVHAPPLSRPGAQPVRLGAHQAWRHADGEVVRYSVPTSAGTLAVTCRATASAGSRPLGLCERTASTLRFRDGTPLPLAAAAEDSRRLRTAIAALEAERKAGRATLGSASTVDDQRLAAENLAESHARAATALRELTGSGPVEAAVRSTADAYSRLAAAAGSGSPERWVQATEHVRRSDAVLAEAIAAGVG